jgi:hypothetical protein
MPGLAFGPSSGRGLRVDPERRFIHRPEGWSVRLSSRRSLGAVEWVKVEGKVDEGQKVIVRYGTAPVKWGGFKSLMVLWTKVYPVRKPRHLWRG